MSAQISYMCKVNPNFSLTFQKKITNGCFCPMNIVFFMANAVIQAGRGVDKEHPFRKSITTFGNYISQAALGFADFSFKTLKVGHGFAHNSMRKSTQLSPFHYPFRKIIFTFTSFRTKQKKASGLPATAQAQAMAGRSDA